MPRCDVGWWRRPVWLLHHLTVTHAIPAGTGPGVCTCTSRMYMYRRGHRAMTEVADGARLLRRHVDELYSIGRIDAETQEMLHEEIDQLQVTIEHYYE